MMPTRRPGTPKHTLLLAVSVLNGFAAGLRNCNATVDMADLSAGYDWSDAPDQQDQYEQIMGLIGDLQDMVNVLDGAMKGGADLASIIAPAGYLRYADLERLAKPGVVGCAASLRKTPVDGFVPIYLGDTP